MQTLSYTVQTTILIRFTLHFSYLFCEKGIINLKNHSYFNKKIRFNYLTKNTAAATFIKILTKQALHTRKWGFLNVWRSQVRIFRIKPKKMYTSDCYEK